MANKTRTSLNLPDSFVAVDVETTGLDAEFCEIIEIGAVVVKEGKILNPISTLIKPINPIPSFITLLTGISNDMVEYAPSIYDAIIPIADLLNGKTVVGHNICFDDKFLRKAISDAGLMCQYTMVDTMRLGRHVFKNLESYRLGDIAEACSVSHNESHRAQDDAVVAAMCALKMRPLVFEKYGEDPDATVRKLHSGGGVRINPKDFAPTVDEIDESNPFFGANILFTGKLSCMTRAEAMQKAVNLGATPLANYSKKVDYLVVGSFDFCANIEGNASGKLKKAQQAIEQGASTRIVSEAFFLDFASEV